jgi:HAD superfamily hydrolase (TIGR01549 family)
MMKDRAVIWDYDGTLVDTRRKNWQVTRALIPAVSGRTLDEFPALASLEAYRAADRRSANWRVLLGQEFGLNLEQVDEAGRLWTRYQLADHSPTPFFNGVAAALEGLQGLPQAIFSQNSRPAIQRALSAAGLGAYFSLVIGYEEVSFERQKPAPDGLLICLEQLGIDQGTVFFVGDHDADVLCARRANEVLAARGGGLQIVAVGVAFGNDGQPTWISEPDYVARRPEEVVTLAMFDSEP